MYHYMQFDPSLIRERNERMRSEMSRLHLQKRLRKQHEVSGPRLVASYLLRLTSTFRPLRGTGAAGR
jgi:hypothetical protein